VSHGLVGGMDVTGDVHTVDSADQEGVAIGVCE
jgi:hypothetical protein